MKRLSISALALAVVTASCSGHNAGLLPPTQGGGEAPQAIAPAGWSATATQGIVPLHATDLGRMRTPEVMAKAMHGTAIPIRMGLALRNKAELQRAIESRQVVTRAQFMARYAPLMQDVAAATSYLKQQGLQKVEVSPDHLLVSASGSPMQIERAFHTELHAFSSAKGAVFANVKTALVPEKLGKAVTAVLGLDNVVKLHYTPSPCFPTDPAPSPVPCLRDFGPQEIQKYYDAGSTPAGSLTTVAVMAEGNVSQVIGDLRYAEVQNGLPQVPATIVTVGLPSGDTSGQDEWDLDTQSSTGMAGAVKGLYIYATTSLTDSDIANEYDHWVTDNKAQLGNSSFGECEYSAYLDGSMAVDDNVLMEGAAQGQTMFASTGDNGSACAVVAANGAPASGLPMVNYPASSPWVIGVGGTTVASNNDGSYLGELAWNAGGGGLSQFENSPKYMQKVQVAGGSVAEANLRGLPDVSMAADPNSGGFNVYSVTPLSTATGPCGEPCGVGGTSEASPLAMGVYARLMSAHNNTLGFAGPQLYNIYIENPNSTATVTGPPPTQVIGGYHDVITGSNGAYSALPSYDYTTGMGSFDVTLTNGLIGH